MVLYLLSLFSLSLYPPTNMTLRVTRPRRLATSVKDGSSTWMHDQLLSWTHRGMQLIGESEGQRGLGSRQREVATYFGRGPVELKNVVSGSDHKEDQSGRQDAYR